MGANGSKGVSYDEEGHVTSCIFCRIIAGEPVGGTRVLYETPSVVAFRPRGPAASRHFLVVSKRHIRNVDSLRASDRPLLEEMRQVGEGVLAFFAEVESVDAEVARRTGTAAKGTKGSEHSDSPESAGPEATSERSDPPVKEVSAEVRSSALFGFHAPPFNSIDHLHMHCFLPPFRPAVTVHSVPVLRDNYAYILRDEANCECWVVDPGEADPVLRAVGDSDLELRGIVNTHWHPDHVGGNEELLRHSRDLEVVGPRQEADKIPGITTSVAAGETVALGALTAQVLACGAHTSGHVMYYLPGPGDDGESDDARPLMFSGDTLFVAGCGRFFEGGAEDMMALVDLLRRGDLPPSTRVYCGHEYTAANVRFALQVEPGNDALQQLAIRTQRMREEGRPTVPTSVAEELRHNPFLRVHEAAVQEAMGTVGDSLATLTRLRQAKDAF